MTTTVGWVMDKDTSRRRLHVELDADGQTVVLTLESGQVVSPQVWLDAEGVTILQGLLGEAVRRARVRP